MNISNYWDHLIIRTISGSRAYGMATAQSDLDIKGIFIPPKPFLLGIHNIEQHQWKYYDEISTLEELNDVMRGIPFDWSANGVEYTYHALRKYVKLAVQCNPNVLEILFAEPTDMIWNGIAPENRKLGELLLGNRHLFLSQRARHSYSGYAVDQLKRIKGHKKFIMSPEPKRAPRHSEFMKFYPMASNGSRIILTPGEDGGSSNPTKHMLSVCGGKPIPGTDNKAFWIYLRGKGLVDKDGALLADYEYNYDPSSPIIGVLVFQKDEYRTRHKKWKEYWDWKKNRNEDRAKMESDFGFDGKHANLKHNHDITTMKGQVR